jgi:hypothetical protein
VALIPGIGTIGGASADMALNYLGLAKTYAQLARVPDDVADDVADAWNARLQAGFDGGTDPYGNAWTALRPATLAKGRFPPPLTEGWALRNSAVLRALAGFGLELDPSPFYGVYHMSGTDYMAKRRYFPDAGLPAVWRQDLQKALSKRVKETVGNG